MTNDPFNLKRFVQAQAADYAIALAEIRAGRKRSHWMWYIFPQFAGLGFSAMSQQYAIGSLAEARAYLSHPMLGPRLLEIAEACAALPHSSAGEIFGSPDEMKLRSSATLFALVCPDDSIFHRLLNQYFDGERDDRTEQLISHSETGRAM